MGTKEKKPFTYTPGGLDLSEIRSEKMAKRLMTNAMSPGVQERPKPPQFTPPSDPETRRSSVPTSAQYCNLPVAVFPCIQIPANPKELLRKTGSAYNDDESNSAPKDKASNVDSSQKTPEKSPEADTLTIEEKINRFSPSKETASEKKSASTENEKITSSVEKETRLTTFDKFVNESDPKISETKTNGFAAKAAPVLSDDEEEVEEEEIEEEEIEEEEEECSEEVEVTEDEEDLIKTVASKTEKITKSDDKVTNKVVQTIRTETTVISTSKDNNSNNEVITKDDKVIIKSEKHINSEVSTDDEVMSSDENVASTDDQRVSSDEETTTKENKTISAENKDDNTISTDAKITQEDEKIVETSDETINKNEHAVIAEDPSISGDEKIIDAEEKVVKADDNLEITDDKKINTNEEKIRSDEEIVKPSDDTDDAIENVTEEITKTDKKIISTDEKVESVVDIVDSAEIQETKISDQIPKTDEKIELIGKKMEEDETVITKEEHIIPTILETKKECDTVISSRSTPEIEKPIVCTLQISPQNKILETITTDIKQSPKMIIGKDMSKVDGHKTIEIDTKQFESVCSDLESNKMTRNSSMFMTRAYSKEKTFDYSTSQSMHAPAPDPMIRHSFTRSPSKDRTSVDGLRILSDLDNIPSLNVCPKRFSFMRDSPPKSTGEDPFSILTGISPNDNNFTPSIYQQSNVEVPPPWETDRQTTYTSIETKRVVREKPVMPAGNTWKSINYNPHIRTPSCFLPQLQDERVDESWKNDLWSNRQSFNQTATENTAPLNYVAKEDSEPSWRRELREMSFQKRDSTVQNEEYTEPEEPPWRKEVRELSQVRNQRHCSMPRIDFESSRQYSDETQNYSTFTREVKRAYTPSPSSFVPEIKPRFDARMGTYMPDPIPTFDTCSSSYMADTKPPFDDCAGTYMPDPTPTFDARSSPYMTDAKPPFDDCAGTYMPNPTPTFDARSSPYMTDPKPTFDARSSPYMTDAKPTFDARSSPFIAEAAPIYYPPGNYTTEVQPSYAPANTYTAEVQSSYAPPPAWSQTVRPKSWRERSADLARERENEIPEWKKTGMLRKSVVNSFLKSTQETTTYQSSTMNDNQKLPEITVEIASQPASNRVAPNTNNGYNYPWETSSESSVAFSPEPFHYERTSTPQSRNSPYRPNSQYSAYSYNSSPVVPREYGMLSFQPPRRYEVRSCPVQSRSFKYLQLLTGTDDSYADNDPYIPQPAHHAYLRPDTY